jgi:hypothetical protein
VNDHENGDGGAARPGEIAHAGLRGVIAAAAMSGMRNLTVSLGLVDQTPPEAIVKQRAHGILRRVPRKRRKAAVEALHWGYGAVGGAAFAVLPEGVRRQPWAGPLYGIVVWLGFELGMAPLLGLKQAKQPRPAERVALAADHLLYGLVLTETRRRTRS